MNTVSAESNTYLTLCHYTKILTAGPEGPAGPVSPSFPDRPCSERRFKLLKGDLGTENDEPICEVSKRGKVFIEKMYLLLDQDDPQVPSLLAFQVHPVEAKSQ